MDVKRIRQQKKKKTVSQKMQMKQSNGEWTLDNFNYGYLDWKKCGRHGAK